MPVGNAWGQTDRISGHWNRKHAASLDRSIAVAIPGEGIGRAAPRQENAAKEHELVETQQETHQEVQA
jgi:hypothetical protein